MKKNKNWLIILPLALCCLVLVIYSAVFVWNDDNTPPVITIESEEMEISVSTPQEELLVGVSAWDECDGDVTADMVVETVSNIGSDHTATITYAAFDKSGNVSKASRKLIYTDYSEPRFGLTRALVFTAGTSPDVLDYVTVEDALDGDLSEQVKGTLVSDTISLSYTGVHQIEFRVTNSMGDTQHLTLPVEICAADIYNASVELTDYLIYIKKETRFHAEDYLKTLKVGVINYSLQGSDPDLLIYINGKTETEPDPEAENEYIRIDIDMDSTVDTKTPGVYSVTYTVNMDYYTGYTRLNVVVEE